MNNEHYRYMNELHQKKRYELGLVSNSTWDKDPRRLVFSLSRYKFVSKMFKDFGKVLEVGCGDGWNAKLVNTEVEHLTLTDADPVFVNNASENSRHWGKLPTCKVHDFISSPLDGCFAGAYCLDVLEHISKSAEDAFIKNIKSSCLEGAVIIFGMPSAESQEHIKPENRDVGHVNCKNLYEMHGLMKKHFRAVLPFSMNDEVLHTGYDKMSQYIINVCIS